MCFYFSLFFVQTSFESWFISIGGFTKSEIVKKKETYLGENNYCKKEKKTNKKVERKNQIENRSSLFMGFWAFDLKLKNTK